MPFIRGRYHINPVMGEALEAARDAEAALLALEERAQRNRAVAQPDGDPDAPDSDDSDVTPAPIHRVEIEGAEVVPNSSGRATRGFAVRVHRLAPAAGSNATLPAAAPPETHVFANHGDLLDFLQQEFARHASQ